MKHWIIALLIAGLCTVSLTACDELDLSGPAGETDTDTATAGESTDTENTDTENTNTENTNTEDTTNRENADNILEDDRLPAVGNVGTAHLVGEPITEREWEKIVTTEYYNYSYKWTVTQMGVTRISYGCVDGSRWLERVFEGDVEVERCGEFSVGDSLLYHSYDFEDHTWVQENGSRSLNHPLSGISFPFADFSFDEATGTYTYRVSTDKTYTDEQLATGAGIVALRFVEGECVYIETADTDETGNVNRMVFEFWDYDRTMVATPDNIRPVSPDNGSNEDFRDDTVGTVPTMPEHNENVKPDRPDNNTNNNHDEGKLPPDHSADSGIHSESSAAPPEIGPMEDAKVDSAPEAVLPPPPTDNEADTEKATTPHKPVDPDEPSVDEDEWLDLNGNGIPDAKE